MKRTLLTLAATVAILTVATPAGSALMPGTDDPATIINEAAVLDDSRFVFGPVSEDPTPMQLAEAYAAARDWTCTSPAEAELDDTFLVLRVHPVDGQPYNDQILEVGLDDALDAKGHAIVLLACDAEVA